MRNGSNFSAKATGGIATRGGDNAERVLELAAVVIHIGDVVASVHIVRAR